MKWHGSASFPRRPADRHAANPNTAFATLFIVMSFGVLDDYRPQETEPHTAGAMQTTVVFLSLFLILLAFFIMLNSVATRDPSKVDSAVSSLTESFARSKFRAPEGYVASKAGNILRDSAVLNEVHTRLLAAESWADLEVSSAHGALLANFDHQKLFIAKTAVLQPEAVSLIQGLAQALSADAGEWRGVVEIAVHAMRIGEIGQVSPMPVPLRQSAAIANEFERWGVLPQNLAVSVVSGSTPRVQMVFFILADREN